MIRAARTVLAFAFALATATTALHASRSDVLSVAWLRDGRVETRTTTGSTMPTVAPLGSTWKLFMFAFAVERNVPTPVYRCGVPRKDGDEYCCDPGQSIDRDHALARSCGRFFDPDRLNIDPVAWRAFWNSRAGANADWLLDVKRLGPETRVSIAQMLRVLASVPVDARAAAERALLPIVIDGYGRGAVSQIGGLLRAKTFTWNDVGFQNGVTSGGAAGWLVDGTPVWFTSEGSSRRVLLDHADTLAEWLPAPRSGPAAEPCVVVDFFAQYPIRTVEELPSRGTAPNGGLAGKYRVQFVNGNALTFSTSGGLTLQRESSRVQVRGQLALSDYIARVLDREADPTITQAARALAIVARTWTLRNARFERGCFIVSDSTRMQRVSANDSTPAARSASWFTDGLVLDGEEVHYHRDTPAPNVLAWAVAVQQAQAGRSFDAILAEAFPKASLGVVSGERECRRLNEADAWLTTSAKAWRRRLLSEPGFEAPDALAVCALDYGNPYADRAHGRIYVRGVATLEDRISIAHEYVHLAFRFHPRRDDEGFVEATARSLVR